MPNWTYNNTQIKGNKVDVANFLNIIKGKDDKVNPIMTLLNVIQCQ